MEEISKILYPEQFHTSNIYTHPKFEGELKEVLELSGFKQNFTSLYRQRLQFLHDRQKQCILKSDWFEILKNTNGLHSMKIRGHKNIRIIFKFAGYKNKQIALLLCTFEEKNSKNKSGNSYNKAIEIANARLDEITYILE